MKPSELRQSIINAYHSKTALMVWGQPGVGKSQIMMQVAKELGLSIIDQRLSQMDPVDMRGIPYVQDGITYWATPGFLPQEKRDGPNGILFFDEINSAPQANQAAAYQLFLDGALGEYKLPDGWIVCAAGNRAEDRAIVNRMSSALSNRMAHETLEVDMDEWIKWAIQNNIDSDIISFIQWRPELLNDFNPDVHSFPTPRSWEIFHKRKPFTNASNIYSTAKSIVGEGAAAEYLAYFKNKQELPDILEILQNPKTCKIPNEASATYALTGMLSSNITESNFADILIYINRLPGEYQTITMQNAIIRNEDLAESSEFIQWSLENNSFIL